MIMPEDEVTTKNNNQDGYTALYDTCKDDIIAAGVILSFSYLGEIYLFEVKTQISILSDEFIEVLEGTMFEYMEDTPAIDIFGKFDGEVPLDSCRFPTQNELEWYDKLETV